MQPLLKENVVAHEQPSVSAQVNVSPSSQEAELSIKVLPASFIVILCALCQEFWHRIAAFQLVIQVMLEPLEVTCDPDIFLNFMEFYNMFKSFDFHHKRVKISMHCLTNIPVPLHYILVCLLFSWYV